MDGLFGVKLIVAPPIFVRFSLFSKSTLFQNFDVSSFNGLKVQRFRGPNWGIPQPGTPDFIPELVLLDIFNRSNFKYSAFNGLKVDSWRRKKKKSKKKEEKYVVSRLGKRIYQKERRLIVY